MNMNTGDRRSWGLGVRAGHSGDAQTSTACDSFQRLAQASHLLGSSFLTLPTKGWFFTATILIHILEHTAV